MSGRTYDLGGGRFTLTHELVSSGRRVVYLVSVERGFSRPSLEMGLISKTEGTGGPQLLGDVLSREECIYVHALCPSRACV